jgi:hypothetical protein
VPSINRAFLDVRVLSPGRGKRFEAIKKRLKKPYQGGGATMVANAIRFGEGSIQEQFKTTTYYTRRGARVPWKPTKPFGNRPAPKRTLHRTGALERAWLGRDAASITRWSGNRLLLGVSTARFPHAGVFQKVSATLIRPKKMGKRGRYAMGWKLGLTYGVWISNRRLEMGLRIDPRRVGVSPRAVQRANASLRDFIITGKAKGSGGFR